MTLKNFLSLYASKAGCGEIGNNLLTGEYDVVETMECTNEKVLRDITGGKERRRIDVWMDVTIKVEDLLIIYRYVCRQKNKI